MFSRRSFLSGLGLTLGSLALPRWALAQAPGGIRFLFVFAPGGWDPTYVFAPLFGNTNIDMETNATAATVGGITFTDSPARPQVRSFFETWHDRTLILNGMQVRSLAHEICMELVLTASSSGISPDWPTLIAAAAPDAFTLPHLVLGGPSYAGDLSAYLCRTGDNGQLEGLLSGQILEGSDLDVAPPPLQSERILDDYIQRRAQARAGGARVGADTRLANAYELALSRAVLLKSAQYDMDFSPGNTLSTLAFSAIDALATDLARCVSIGHPSSWDTHSNNTTQSGLFTDLFTGLSTIMDLLQTTTAPSGKLLSEETMVVVLSEMGRTPQLNSSQGKDHWPYTSAMLVGPGITGSRVVGGYDTYFNGQTVDPTTAEVAVGAPPLSVENLGATLLTLGGVDPAAYIRGGVPLSGVLT